MSTNVTDLGSTKDPEMLYAASIERMHEAEALRNLKAWGYSMYTAGLAVETLLQAFAIRNGAAFDAKHDFSKWLNKCPVAIIDLIHENAKDEWSRICAVWSNSLRYCSRDGVLRRLRASGHTKNIRTGAGGADDAIRENARRFIESARTVQAKGMALWRKDN